MIRAETEARLLTGVPFSKDLSHTLMFDSLAEQVDYFKSLTKSAMDNITYQRQDGYIRWSTEVIDFDTINACNYVMYRNRNNGNKWYFAFITKVEYINDKTAHIYIETDYFQSYLFDVSFKPSLIERKHLNKSPLIPEGIDYGNDYEVVSNRQISGGSSDIRYLLITMSENVKDKAFMGTVISGIPVPYTFYLIPFDKKGKSINVNGTSMTDPQYVMGNLGIDESTVNKALSFNILHTLPFKHTASTSNVTSDFLKTEIHNEVAWARVTDHVAEERVLYTIPSVNASNKIDTYPYRLYELSDTYGNKIELKPEFLNGTHQIIERTILSYMPKTIYSVSNYMGNSKAFVSVAGSHATDIPVVNDQTAAYFQSHRNSKMSIVNRVSSGALMGASAGVGGAIGGAVGGAIMGTVDYSLSRHSKELDLANVPNNIRGSVPETIFDFAFDDMQGVYLRELRIPANKRKQLDSFWKKFGYKYNEIDNPIKRTKKDYMYVKTSDLVVRGQIPQNAMDEIQKRFNNGITLWYNKDVGNYNLSNGGY